LEANLLISSSNSPAFSHDLSIVSSPILVCSKSQAIFNQAQPNQAIAIHQAFAEVTKAHHKEDDKDKTLLFKDQIELLTHEKFLFKLLEIFLIGHVALSIASIINSICFFVAILYLYLIYISSIPQLQQEFLNNLHN
jgi:hypothetical protein